MKVRRKLNRKPFYFNFLTNYEGFIKLFLTKTKGEIK